MNERRKEGRNEGRREGKKERWMEGRKKGRKEVLSSGTELTVHQISFKEYKII